MKKNPKWLQFIIFVIAFATVIWIYDSYDRHRLIIAFFKTPEDLAWAKTYLNKKINFCDAPWQDTKIHKIASEEYYGSPTGGLKVHIYTNSEHEEGFDLIDTKSKKNILTFKFQWDPKGAGLGHDDLKWARSERYLIFRKPITMDSDWATSQVYAADTTNGEVIYMGDSEFYDCAARNW